MSTLTEYAERMAERDGFGSLNNPEDAAFAEGILHLAEQLQRDDVMEAGTVELATSDGRLWSVMDEVDREQYRRYLPTALVAMLAKIAGGDL